jgi:hypothetical protein
MALDVVPQPAPIEPSQADDGGSLADHEAQFKRNGSQPAVGPEDDDDDGEDRGRDDAGRFQPRHRAASQEAKPEDVNEIKALTKTLREKEAELAKLNPDSVAGSKRLLNLKRQIKAVEADLDGYKPKVEVKPTPKVDAPAVFDAKEPTLEQFADQPDPYLAFTRAMAKYDRQKDAFDAKKAEADTSVKANVKAEIDAFQARERNFAEKTADYDAVTKPIRDGNLPELLVAAIVKSDKGPSFVYHLAQHQDVLDELVLLTDGKAVSDASVAIVQRRLAQRAVQDAPTGSSAEPLPSYIPPRPPNPVRTGPIRTGEEPLGDDASLAEHEARFNRRRRS